jgi:hypothetical protein
LSARLKLLRYKDITVLGGMKMAIRHRVTPANVPKTSTTTIVTTDNDELEAIQFVRLDRWETD